MKGPRRPRPDWNSYFMSFAYLATDRSTCLRRQVGAVIVKNRQILTTGYNGQPRRVPHAEEVGCFRQRMGVKSGTRHELCRGLHAEQNAIIQAAYHGVQIKDAELYCTTFPCAICVKMIINAGIRAVYYVEDYAGDDVAGDLAKALIEESGLEVHRLDYTPVGPTAPPEVSQPSES